MRFTKILPVTALLLAVTLPAHAGSLSVETRPQPEVGKSVLRETRPLSGTTASEVETVVPPAQVGKTAPVVEVPPPLTPDGKVVSGSTDITKKEEQSKEESASPVTPD